MSKITFFTVLLIAFSFIYSICLVIYVDRNYNRILFVLCIIVTNLSTINCIFALYISSYKIHEQTIFYKYLVIYTISISIIVVLTVLTVVFTSLKIDLFETFMKLSYEQEILIAVMSITFIMIIIMIYIIYFIVETDYFNYHQNQVNEHNLLYEKSKNEFVDVNDLDYKVLNKEDI